MQSNFFFIGKKHRKQTACKRQCKKPDGSPALAFFVCQPANVVYTKNIQRRVGGVIGLPLDYGTQRFNQQTQ
jgi:hypothetical protein